MIQTHIRSLYYNIMVRDGKYVVVNGATKICLPPERVFETIWNIPSGWVVKRKLVPAFLCENFAPSMTGYMLSCIGQSIKHILRSAWGING